LGLIEALRKRGQRRHDCRLNLHEDLAAGFDEVYGGIMAVESAQLLGDFFARRR